MGPYTEKTLAASRLREYPFRLGVASGDPRAAGVVLWTRLAPRPHEEGGHGGMPRKRFDVRWEVASDERFRRVVRRGVAPARPELGHSIHVEVGGLLPARRYFYRFKAGSHTSPVGRTATVPATGRAVRELTFAVAACQHYEHGHYTAYRHMAREDLDLVVHLGDYSTRGDRPSTPPRPRRSVSTTRASRGGSGPIAGAMPSTGRPGPSEGARGLPLDRHLGRPRGGEQLCRRDPRARPVERDVPAAPGGGLSGLLRAHAATTCLGASGARHAALPAHSLRRPCALPVARHPAVPP